MTTTPTPNPRKWDGWAERRRAEQGVDEPRTTTASDGTTLTAGDKAFNYYDMKPGTVGAIDFDGWFRFTHDDGTSATLNGERVCSLATAAAEPWNGRR